MHLTARLELVDVPADVTGWRLTVTADGDGPLYEGSLALAADHGVGLRVLPDVRTVEALVERPDGTATAATVRLVDGVGTLRIAP